MGVPFFPARPDSRIHHAAQSQVSGSRAASVGSWAGAAAITATTDCDLLLSFFGSQAPCRKPAGSSPPLSHGLAGGEQDPSRSLLPSWPRGGGAWGWAEEGSALAGGPLQGVVWAEACAGPTGGPHMLRPVPASAGPCKRGPQGQAEGQWSCSRPYCGLRRGACGQPGRAVLGHTHECSDGAVRGDISRMLLCPSNPWPRPLRVPVSPNPVPGP